MLRPPTPSPHSSLYLYLCLYCCTQLHALISPTKYCTNLVRHQGTVTSVTVQVSTTGPSFQPLEVASCCPGPNSPNNHETACCSAASRGNALSCVFFLRIMIPDGHETPDGPPFTLSLSCCFTALHCHLALQGTIHTGLHAELSHLGAYIGGRLGGLLSS